MKSILLSRIEYGFSLVKNEIEKMVKEDSKIVIFPWAFPLELDYDRLNNEYFKKGSKKYNKYINPLLEIGFKEENIIILNCYDKNCKSFKEIIRNSQFLLLLGGNPEMFYSKVVQETELLYELKHYNGVIIGESAGACLQFKRYFITAKNNFYKYFAFYDGFGIIEDPFYLDVHTINNSFYLKSLQKIADKYKKRVYAIYDDGAIIYDRKHKTEKLYGNVKCFYNENCNIDK